MSQCLSSTLVLALAGLGTAAARADDASDVDAITPYRPTVSTPAQLPVPGQVELELGGLRVRSDAVRRSSLPYLLKLGFSPEWGVLVGGEAHVWQHDGSGVAQGIGDTNVTLKHAWLVGDATAFGAEFTVKLPTANDSIGNGNADYTVNTIFSRDFGPVHVDANLNGTRLGASDAGSSRTLIGASASFSTPLSEHWGAAGEFSGTHQDGEKNGSQVLAALTYSPSKRLTFDFGGGMVMATAAGRHQIFIGVVLPIAKLW